MNRTLKVARLQMNKPDVVFVAPAVIVLLVLAVTMVISFALQRAGLDPASPDYAEGARFNMGMIWALPGFLIYFGVQAIATTFPFALAVGATRRAHVFGTAIANAVTSAYVAIIMVILLAIELATNHWFFGVYALDIYMLGEGNAWVLFATAFLGTFVCTSLGGMFGAVWVRFGSRGPVVVGLALALILAVLILIYIPHFEAILAGITHERVALVAIGVIAAAILGTWVAMRRASVR